MTHRCCDYPSNHLFSLRISDHAAFFECFVLNLAAMQILASDLNLYVCGGFSGSIVAELHDNLENLLIVLIGR